MINPCYNPLFLYNFQRMVYDPCENCGELAWSHRGSRPLIDVVNHMEWMRNGALGQPPAPVVDPG